MLKTCTKCHVAKYYSEFYADKTRTDGLYPQCRACAASSKARSRAKHGQNREAILAWRRDNPDRVRLMDRKQLLKKYGLTIEDYERLVREQEGSCALCGEPPTQGNLAVDHCHTSGRVRGLLCRGCNTGLGNFKESPELLDRAANYLRTHSC